MDCIFCQIINKKESSDIVYENDSIIVIKDINPSAPIHLLIIPKKHITSVAHLEPGDKDLMGQMILTAKKIAEEKGLKAYNLRINIGREAGQIIDHLHMHLLSR